MVILFSLMIAPVMAQSVELCKTPQCLSYNTDQGTDSQQPDSKSSAKADHCCVCSHAASDISFSKIGYIEPDSNKLFHFKDAALFGHEPQGLLRPPQAA